MNVDEMEAGRELDALVAEKVMGWTNCDPAWGSKSWEFYEAEFVVGIGKPPNPPSRWQKCAPIPHYSIDMTMAWKVVLELESHGFILSLFDRLGYDELEDGRIVSMWRCEFMDEGAHAIDRPNDEIWFGIAQAETAELAICRAALIAVEAEMSFNHVVFAYCLEEFCGLCGNQATHKITEDWADPALTNHRHPFTAYVCCKCFGKIFGYVATQWCASSKWESG